MTTEKLNQANALQRQISDTQKDVDKLADYSRVQQVMIMSATGQFEHYIFITDPELSDAIHALLVDAFTKRLEEQQKQFEAL